MHACSSQCCNLQVEYCLSVFHVFFLRSFASIRCFFAFYFDLVQRRRIQSQNKNRNEYRSGEAQQQSRKKTWSKAECVHIVHTVTHTLAHGRTRTHTYIQPDIFAYSKCTHHELKYAYNCARVLYYTTIYTNK